MVPPDGALAASGGRARAAERAVKAVTANQSRFWYGSKAVETSTDKAPPRILILEPDSKDRATLLSYAVKGWQGAAVQSTAAARALNRGSGS